MKKIKIELNTRQDEGEIRKEKCEFCEQEFDARGGGYSREFRICDECIINEKR